LAICQMFKRFWKHSIAYELMVKDIDHLVKQNEKLNQEKVELNIKLNEAIDIIESIRTGNIDAVFIASDGTEKVLAAKTADQAYRRFIENMSEGVITLHTDGIIIYSNSSFAKMVQRPLESLIGTNLREYIPIEQSEAFEVFFGKYPQYDTKAELSFFDLNGIRRYFNVSVNAIYLQDFMALNLVWSDVTDLKEAIEERILSEKEVVILNNRLNENINILKNANIELSTFAHIASHDLQEPLRKIMIYSKMLKAEYYEAIDQQGQRYINKMHDASARMRNLVNDILEYSELSKDEILFRPVKLQLIIEEVISDLDIALKETKAMITVVDELPIIEANPGQIRQLFQNIIGNSLKFIKPDILPQISITYKIANGRQMGAIDEGILDIKFCVIYFKDNGIGFDPAYAGKIFTIFQRLNNSAVYEGTGIGLAICKRIVERHHGLIMAESKPGEGALFTITLPVFQKKSVFDGGFVSGPEAGH
jgi:PAS domain S-box-containing protein